MILEHNPPKVKRFAIIDGSIVDSDRWRKLGVTAMRAFVAIALHADEHGKAFPRRETIAALIGASQRNTDRAIQTLEDRGLLTRHRGGGRTPDGKYRSTVYRIATGAQSDTVEKANRGAERQLTGAQSDSQQGRRVTVNRGAERLTNNTVNSTVNNTENNTENIYQAYPRRVGKSAALKAISKAIKRIAAGDDQPDEGPPDDAAAWLLTKTRQFADSPAGQQGTFTPYPGTWFNQSRYLDNPAEWSLTDDRSSNTKPGRVRPRPDDDWDAGGIKLPPPEQ